MSSSLRVRDGQSGLSHWNWCHYCICEVKSSFIAVDVILEMSKLRLFGSENGSTAALTLLG